MRITQSEWEAELVKYFGRSVADGFTSYEMSEALGITGSSASVKISQGIRTGKIKFVGYKDTLNVLGAPLKRPCYQFVKKEDDAASMGNVVRHRGRRLA